MLRTQATNALRRAAPRAYSTQALSNPTLKNIEKRWEGMPLQEQADLWMALRDRMKGSWSELTLQEKKAGTLCSFFPSSSCCSQVPCGALKIPPGLPSLAPARNTSHGFANNNDHNEQFAAKSSPFQPTSL